MAGKLCQAVRKKRVLIPKEKRRPSVRIKVPRAEQVAASAERKALVRRDKQAFEIVQKAKDTAVLRSLVPVAKEINTRLEKATALDEKAGDHRLAAALQLDKARQVCKASKITFKGWVQANIEYSLDEVKKLVAVAAKPDPAKALADMRAGVAQRSRELRARRKALRDAPPPSPAEVLDALSDEQALEVVAKKAESVGMRVISEAELEKQRGFDAPMLEGSRTVAGMRTAFLALRPSEKLMFVKWAGDAIGVVVTGDFQVGEDLVDIRPNFLKRKQK